MPALALLHAYHTLSDVPCRYGIAKGTVLTAWRLLRCNPWGGSGYDPTSWPPVGLAPLFALPYSAEVAVVVGTALVVRFTHALLFE